MHTLNNRFIFFSPIFDPPTLSLLVIQKHKSQKGVIVFLFGELMMKMNLANSKDVEPQLINMLIPFLFNCPPNKMSL